MNNNQRIALGALVAVALLTVLTLLMNSSVVLWVAYGWNLTAILIFTLSVIYWANSKTNNYILRTAYPLILKYCSAIIVGIAVVVALLDQVGISLSWKWFCLIELCVVGFFTWRMLAVDAGRSAIEEVDNYVNTNTALWKLMIAEITAIADRTAVADAPKVRRTMEAVRYADPMALPELYTMDQHIYDEVMALGQAVDNADSGAIEELCIKIERDVKDRTNRMLILKK